MAFPRIRRAKFIEGQLDTASAALMHIHYTNCLVSGTVVVSRRRQVKSQTETIGKL